MGQEDTGTTIDGAQNDEPVRVVWLDSQHDIHQVDPEDLPNPAQLVSIGHLSASDMAHIVISRDRSPGEHSYEWRANLAIPRRAIISVECLSRPGEERGLVGSAAELLQRIQGYAERGQQPSRGLLADLEVFLAPTRDEWSPCPCEGDTAPAGSPPCTRDKPCPYAQVRGWRVTDPVEGVGP